MQKNTHVLIKNYAKEYPTTIKIRNKLNYYPEWAINVWRATNKHINRLYGKILA